MSISNHVKKGLIAFPFSTVISLSFASLSLSGSFALHIFCTRSPTLPLSISTLNIYTYRYQYVPKRANVQTVCVFWFGISHSHSCSYRGLSKVKINRQKAFFPSTYSCRFLLFLHLNVNKILNNLNVMMHSAERNGLLACLPFSIRLFARTHTFVGLIRSFGALLMFVE